MGDMRGLDGIENDFGYGSKAYLEPGVYALEVNKAWYDERRTDGAPYVVAEFVVLESTCASRPVGSITTKYFDLRPENPGRGSLREFVATIYGAPVDKVGKEEIKLALSEAQPLAGKKIRASATEGTSKKGNKVTNVEWIAYEKKKAA